jgi:hypothetical protein
MSAAQAMGSWARMPLEAWVCSYFSVVCCCVQTLVLRQADHPLQDLYHIWSFLKLVEALFRKDTSQEGDLAIADYAVPPNAVFPSSCYFLSLTSSSKCLYIINFCPSLVMRDLSLQPYKRVLGLLYFLFASLVSRWR